MTTLTCSFCGAVLDSRDAAHSHNLTRCRWKRELTAPYRLQAKLPDTPIPRWRLVEFTDELRPRSVE
jgi:hypothetical protein